MSVTEVNSVMKFKDKDGNVTAIYPITKDNVVTTTGDGSAYLATVKGISALTTGVSFVMIPHVVSTATSPTINVNGLGAVRIRRRLTSATTTTYTGHSDAWLSAGKPVKITYDGAFWIADIPKPVAADLSGSVPIANGGTGATTAADARTNLGAVSMTSTSAVLHNYVGAWNTSTLTQTVSVTGVTSSNTVIVSPRPDYFEAYTEAGVRCTAQADDSLTFTCDSVPTTAIYVNVVILT